MSSDNLEKKTKKVDEVLENSKTYKIANCKFLNVRKRPIKKGKAIVIDKYDKMEVLEDVDDWVKVDVITRDDLTGYVMKDFIKEV